MKIFAVLMQYDYGVKARGSSYEYLNVYLPLCDVIGPTNVILFDFLEEYKQHGKARMNEKLLQMVQQEKPDLAIFCLFTDEFEAEIIDRLNKLTRTACCFFDDPWRQEFVRRWITHFQFFTTGDYYMFLQYQLEGIAKAIYAPFGFNQNIYKKLNLEKKYDVSFIGGYSPFREWVFSLLKKQGIKVNIFGRNWGKMGSWVDCPEMINIFNQSKINLNLSNAVYYDFQYLRWSLRSIKTFRRMLSQKKIKEQVKGRHYEINACGGFQLSFFIPGLNLVYEIDREIVVYEDIRALPQLIEFYLKNDSLRQSIAVQGYHRSQKEHSAQGYLRRTIEQIMGNKIEK